MTFRALTVIAMVALFGVACGEGSDPGDTGGSGGSAGSAVGGSGGGGTGGTGGSGGTAGTGGTGGSAGTGGSGGEGGTAGSGGSGGEGGTAGSGGSGGSEDLCGNGVLDDGEACDDGNRLPDDGCSANCEIEPSCGNGIVEGTEVCDGAVPEGTTCTSLGFDRGEVACTDCLVDSSGCSHFEDCTNAADDDGDGATDCDDSECSEHFECPVCGNGVIQQGEECEGAPAATCESLGFDAGAIACTGCAVDTSGCVTWACGNGIVEGTEECDDGNATDGDGCSACISDGPLGDNCINPMPIVWNGTNTQAFAMGDTANYTPDYDAASCSETTAQNDIVASLTAPAAGLYRIQANTGFDAVMYVWSGSCDELTATEIGCSDVGYGGDPEYVVVSLAANQTVYVVLGGYGFTSTPVQAGAFTLTATPINNEPNDSAATATPLSFASAELVIDEIAPVTDVDWFSFSAVAGSDYEFFTASSFDWLDCHDDDGSNTFLTLYDATGTALASNDDDVGMNCSYLYWTATTSGTYYVEAKASPLQSSPTPISPYFLFFYEY